MKIAVIGANTRLGRLIVIEAERSGIQVTSIVNDYKDLVGNGPVKLCSYTDLVYSDINKFYALIDATSFLDIASFSLERLPCLHVCHLLQKENIKLLCVGSPALLYTDKSKTELFGDNVDIQNSIRGSDATRQILTLKRMRDYNNVNWSLLCPPMHLDEKGYGKGRYEFSDDVLPLDVTGRSSISYKDLSLACIDYLKRGPKSQSVISVRSL